MHVGQSERLHHWRGRRNYLRGLHAATPRSQIKSQLRIAVMSKIVNGASLQPLSGPPPKHIIFLLHGFGSSGADLIEMATHWRQSLPDTLFLGIHPAGAALSAM
jgi:hypothetical protein